MNFILRLRGNDFFNDELSCLGWQFTEILMCLKDYMKSYDWYIFDVLGTSKLSLFELFPKNSMELCIISSIEELIDKVKEVVQFESGVFIAIKKGIAVEWDHNYLPETEEDEGLQHSFADLEIRLFDYSFFEIYGNDRKVKKRILSHFERKISR